MAPAHDFFHWINQHFEKRAIYRLSMLITLSSFRSFYLRNPTLTNLPRIHEIQKKQRTFFPLRGLNLGGWLNTDYQHDKQEIPLSNLPGPGRLEFVVDGHVASGNPTDPVLAAAGRTMVLSMFICIRFHIEPNSRSAKHASN